MYRVQVRDCPHSEKGLIEKNVVGSVAAPSIPIRIARLESADRPRYNWAGSGGKVF